VKLALHTGDLNPRGRALIEACAARGAPVEAVSQPVMRAASDTQTPQGVLLVLALQPVPLPRSLDFIFIPDGVRDPGNLGSMLRSAAAAAVDACLVPDGSVDVFAPKVVRAGMGAHFRLPVQTASWEDIVALLQAVQLKVYLAEAGAALEYTRSDLRLPLALVIGGEASGPGQQARSLAHEKITIPMPGGSESLNAAAAAAILLFEVVRQRSA
jgi:TrmH family RNA methyltransferase